MRIVGGKFRGRKLSEFQGESIRPTADKVKEALFSILQFQIVDATVLDLFAGTGNLSFESLSRGAKHAVLCDISKESCAIIKKNAEHLNVDVELYNVPAKFALSRLKGRAFDLIFLDPPYNKNLGIEALQILDSNDNLSEDGVIVFEHDADEKFTFSFETLEHFNSRRYGKTVLEFFRRRLV